VFPRCAIAHLRFAPTRAVSISSQPRPLAALALYDFVTLLEQALALAILALLLLFDVGASFIGHAILQIVTAGVERETTSSRPGTA
jgi:hypothetical protein